jgi:hypothetical protein
MAREIINASDTLPASRPKINSNFEELYDRRLVREGWSFASISARDAASVTAADIGFVCFVESPAGYYELRAVTPSVVWRQVGGDVLASRQVATVHSLTGGGTLGADRSLSLVGDTASPGANHVYGTDASGERTWKPDPISGAAPAGADNQLQMRSGAGFAAANVRQNGAVLELRNDASAQSLDVFRTWGAAGVNFESARLGTASGASSSVYAVLQALSGGTGSANMHVALQPRGTGGVSAQVSNGAISGGNARGTRSVDWQSNRSTSGQVASGSDSVISGGSSNTASGSNSVVAGGSNNSASADSAVGGGASNNASGGWATVAGGQSGTASGSRAAVGGGRDNTASGTYAVVAGGYGNTSSGQASWIPGGESASTRALTGAYAWASSARSATGDAQVFGQVVRITTTNATPTVATATGGAVTSANVLVLPNNSGWAGTCKVLGRNRSTGEVFCSVFSYILARRGANAASTTIVDSTSSSASDSAMSLAGAEIIADTTVGAVAVRVTGLASTTIDWVADFSGVQGA